MFHHSEMYLGYSRGEMAGVGVGLKFKMTGGCRVCVGTRTSISISDIHHHEIYHHISESKRKKSIEGREVA